MNVSRETIALEYLDFKLKSFNLNRNTHRRCPRTRKNTISGSQLRSLWQNASGRCAVCGRHDEITIDHKIPLSAGGEHVFKNLQLLCQPCNRKKGSIVSPQQLEILESQLKQKEIERKRKKDRKRETKARIEKIRRSLQ